MLTPTPTPAPAPASAAHEAAPGTAPTTTLTTTPSTTPRRAGGSPALRVACRGGGPAGLFTAILLKLADPAHQVTVFERNAVDDTFGFGVVFSEETLSNIAAADPVSMQRIETEFRHWSAIDVDFLGRSERSDGHAFAALARKRLLQILTERALQLGVDVRHRTPSPALEQLQADYDLVVAADGVNSATRNVNPQAFGASVDVRTSKYVWFGTTKPFECFSFFFVDTPHGMFWAHVYPFDDTRSTFIVETDEDTWERAGLADFAARPRTPGENDEASLAFCEKVFSEVLDGHPLLGNNSGWLNFSVVRNERWALANTVLLGDAAHTAHFSIGSGTKLALEDAIALVDALRAVDFEPTDVPQALSAYDAARRPVVASLQRSAQTSLEWFEGAARYRELAPEQFTAALLTRSQRITYDNLKLRDADYSERLDAWLTKRTRDNLAGTGVQVAEGTPPMFHPYRVKDLVLANRIVVSPMAQYCAIDGLPTDWHLVHLGSRAVGGAALVMTEMTCVSPQGRITPGCPGLWNEDQQQAWSRIVDFVHEQSPAAIGVQLGHSGRKGSTKRMWEGMDEPLPEGGWQVLGPSPLPYLPDSPVPREMTDADIAEVIDQHAAATRRALAAGFDWLELHFAHGYLVSSFLSPLSNHRSDGYGGDLAGRSRLALEVLDAVRAIWPQERPLSVRISATDWVDADGSGRRGFNGDDAVQLSRWLHAHGADVVDVSTGQTSPHARPAYGRLYQTPFSDRVRQEAGVPTITVGAVSSTEDTNTIIATGRADLVAIARPHLVDPYWTLNAALDTGYRGHPLPKQYRSGRSARRRAQQP
ncbi:bifunctional salicylyl-CoA 5-hydroxylase/oxidoreductase [Kineococcus arenarius]|uniref:bifunctional salicylyl-CoA 5-hydroxylase/oxidoreductase n=1 Tax=Kineococcus sp. SYSU DK007 TaxID=3383128 RepID=UPI003D7CDFA6